MDRLGRIEKILEKLAKSQDEANRQRAKDKTEADRQRAKDKTEADRQRAKDKTEADRQRAKDKTEADRQRAKDNAEYEARQKEADRRLAENQLLINSFGSKFRGMGLSIGEITEAITVSDKLIGVVNSFEGIDVDGFLPNLEKTHLIDPHGEPAGKNLRQFEIDGLVVGKNEAVIIEAKTKLTKSDVNTFIKRLGRFKEVFYEYGNHDIYACVAYVRSNENALAYAEKRGLFVIRATPPDVTLINSKGFKPTKFA